MVLPQPPEQPVAAELVIERAAMAMSRILWNIVRKVGFEVGERVGGVAVKN